MSEPFELPSQVEFGDAAETARDTLELVRPPRRMKVSEAAQQYCRVLLPNGSFGAWDPAVTPELVEPMDILNDRLYDALVVVGPARSGKTTIFLGWTAYVVVCDPGDMQLIHDTKDMARDFSRRELDRTLRNSPELRARMSGRGHDDNTFDKIFRAGNILNLSYPTIEQLSSRGIKFIAATDYDRRKRDDVGGEGDLFGLMRKRTETFMSSGKTYIETSPGFPVSDPAWKPRAEAPHEAPPCLGALRFFNEGDRRRRYWPCPTCGEYFLAEMENLAYEEHEDLAAAAKTTRCQCPHCRKTFPFKDRNGVNAKGVWLREGEYIKPDGTRFGNPRVSRIASFWFQGPVARFQTWENLILSQLLAEAEYEKSGSEESLKRTVTQDQGRPYLPKARESERSYIDLMDRAEDLGYRVVPAGVRFLVASIDVQKDCFIVQVEGYGVGLEHWFVDRFKIDLSDRRTDEGDRMPLRPATYADDWLRIIDEVIQKTYPLGDDSGRRMRVRHVSCDSGGKAGVTERAYQFFRRLRARGLAGNFMLVKGDDKGPRIKVSYPDSQRKDRRAKARGEIPVHFLNTVTLKDHLYASLDRSEPGAGCSHFPDWFEDWWYKELLAEIKVGEKYSQLHRRNESLDLTIYNRANLLKCGGEDVNWQDPPGWAKPWADNTLVFDPNRTDRDPPPSGGGSGGSNERTGAKKGNRFEDLGRELG